LAGKFAHAGIAAFDHREEASFVQERFCDSVAEMEFLREGMETMVTVKRHLEQKRIALAQLGS
jgi:hypothetical protein